MMGLWEVSLDYREETSNPVWNGGWTTGRGEGRISRRRSDLKRLGEMNLALPGVEWRKRTVQTEGHSRRQRAGLGEVVAEVGQAEPQQAGDLGKERGLRKYKQWGCVKSVFIRECLNSYLTQHLYFYGLPLLSQVLLHYIVFGFPVFSHLLCPCLHVPHLCSSPL